MTKLARLLAFIVFIIGFLAILGHVVEHKPLYSWGAELGMAITTAVCFCSLSVAVIVLSIRYELR